MLIQAPQIQPESPVVNIKLAEKPIVVERPEDGRKMSFCDSQTSYAETEDHSPGDLKFADFSESKASLSEHQESPRAPNSPGPVYDYSHLLQLLNALAEQEARYERGKQQLILGFPEFNTRLAFKLLFGCQSQVGLS